MNPSQSRLKRTAPERSGPIRNPLVNGAPRPPSPPPSTPTDALRGALECGVQTAYAVIDEYIQRGYEAARNNPNQQDGKGHMNNEKPGYGNWSNPWGPMMPFVEQWSAAMRAWTDAWAAFLPGGRQGAWPGQPYSAAAAGMGTAAPSQPISVEVSSHRPTEVTVYLKPCIDLTGLTADSFVPALPRSVYIQDKGGCPRVRVTIAKDQPAGRYNGVIRSADGSVVGDLTVVISDAATGPA